MLHHATLGNWPFSSNDPSVLSAQSRARTQVARWRAEHPSQLGYRGATTPIRSPTCLSEPTYLPACLPTHPVAYRPTDLPTRFLEPPTCIITYLHWPPPAAPIIFVLARLAILLIIMVVPRRGSNPGRLGESQASLPTRLQERCPLHCLGQFA